jgi:hypothetical protein
MTGIVCKSCNRKFPDTAPDTFIKECPYCNYRFYAHLTYELRMIESRQQRHERRIRRRTFAERLQARESRPIRQRLAEACGGLFRTPLRSQ